MNLEIIFAILFACVFLYLVLSFYSQNRFDDFIDWYKRFGWRSIKLLKKQDEISFTKSDRTDRIIKLFIAGILMLVLAYPLTFTIRAYAISGRDTRVHAAAVVGAAVVWACIGWVFIAIGKAYGKRRIVIFLFTVLFALLVGYGFVIQRDYVDAWRYQKTFWTELLDIIPDVGEGDVILIEPSGLVDTRQIAANYWNLPRVLDQIYKYPEEWEYPPRVYRLIPGWEDTIASNGGSFTVNASNVISPAPYYREVPCSQVIFIETVSGSMQRRVSALNVNGVEYCLKPLDRTDKLYDPGVLYDLIVDW